MGLFNDLSQEVASFVIEELRRTAESALGEAITQAVITVPAYFDEAQRQATRDAGAIAGVDVVRILNEPTAAALAYGAHRAGKGRRLIAVFDLGGGTFDVSIMAEIRGNGRADVDLIKGADLAGRNLRYASAARAFLVRADLMAILAVTVALPLVPQMVKNWMIVRNPVAPFLQHGDRFIARLAARLNCARTVITKRESQFTRCGIKGFQWLPTAGIQFFE